MFDLSSRRVLSQMAAQIKEKRKRKMCMDPFVLIYLHLINLSLLRHKLKLFQTARFQLLLINQDLNKEIFKCSLNLNFFYICLPF